VKIPASELSFWVENLLITKINELDIE